MTSISTQSPTGIQLPKTLRNLAEAAIATAAIALLAQVSAANAASEQSAPQVPQVRVESAAIVLQAGGPLQQSTGYGPLEPLPGDIDPVAATRQRVAAAINEAERESERIERDGGLRSLGQTVEIEF